MKEVIAVAVLVLIAVFVFKHNTWQGFYYPDGCLSCSDQYVYSPIYHKKDQCLAWARDLQESRNNPSDRFECGHNCRGDKSSLLICKETIDE